MRVLVACEYSGLVRDAFINKGHEALSCDLKPTERPGPHYEGSVFDIINDGWDLMIAFPPCTHLAVSGSRHFAKKIADGRQQEGISFFKALASANIPKIAIENPVGIMSKNHCKPSQIIHPWQFGHTEQKTTCLWLKWLPNLRPTHNVYDEMIKLPYAERCKNHMLFFTEKDKNLVGHLRSKTYQGIADAMAEQWGDLTAEKEGFFY